MGHATWATHKNSGGLTSLQGTVEKLEILMSTLPACMLALLAATLCKVGGVKNEITCWPSMKKFDAHTSILSVWRTRICMLGFPGRCLTRVLDTSSSGILVLTLLRF